MKAPLSPELAKFMVLSLQEDMIDKSSVIAQPTENLARQKKRCNADIAADGYKCVPVINAPVSKS